jgi:hypothetical protein
MKPNPFLTTLIATAALTLPLCAQSPAPADSPTAASPAASPAAAAKAHYGGTVSSVDATARTITVTNKKQGTKTFSITDATKLTKTDGTAITLADIKPGDHVHGAFDTNPDGTLLALTVKSGPKTEK